MKNTLIPYLVFHGNCEEALNFYAKVFDGKINAKTTFGASPMNVSSEFENRIFNADFEAGGIQFKASDDLPDHPVTQGSSISLFVTFKDREERENSFNQITEAGKVLFPLDDGFGMAVDKFGVQWMMVMHE